MVVLTYATVLHSYIITLHLTGGMRQSHTENRQVTHTPRESFTGFTFFIYSIPDPADNIPANTECSTV